MEEQDLVQSLKKDFLTGQLTFKTYLSNELGVQASPLLTKSLTKKFKNGNRMLIFSLLQCSDVTNAYRIEQHGIRAIHMETA